MRYSSAISIKYNIPEWDNLSLDMQRYLIDMAYEYLMSNMSTEGTDMFGRPEVYLPWNYFFEEIKPQLPELLKNEQARINNEQMDEAGQGKLFNEEEEKAAMYSYKNLDEMLKEARHRTVQTVPFINISNESFTSLKNKLIKIDEKPNTNYIMPQIFSEVISFIENTIKGTENNTMQFYTEYATNPITIASYREPILKEKQNMLPSSNSKDVSNQATDIPGEFDGTEYWRHTDETNLKPSYAMDDISVEEVKKIFRYPDINIFYKKINGAVEISQIKISDKNINIPDMEFNPKEDRGVREQVPWN
jgi:hypothetical protein